MLAFLLVAMVTDPFGNVATTPPPVLGATPPRMTGSKMPSIILSAHANAGLPKFRTAQSDAHTSKHLVTRLASDATASLAVVPPRGKACSLCLIMRSCALLSSSVAVSPRDQSLPVYYPLSPRHREALPHTSQTQYTPRTV